MHQTLKEHESSTLFVETFVTSGRILRCESLKQLPLPPPLPGVSTSKYIRYKEILLRITKLYVRASMFKVNKAMHTIKPMPIQLA